MAHIFKQGVIAFGECVIVFHENHTLSNVNAAPVFAEVARIFWGLTPLKAKFPKPILPVHSRQKPKTTSS